MDIVELINVTIIIETAETYNYSVVTSQIFIRNKIKLLISFSRDIHETKLFPSVCDFPVCHKISSSCSIREAEARRTDQPNYHAAIVGHEPETVRDDLHELEGTFAPDNVDLRINAPIRGG